MTDMTPLEAWIEEEHNKFQRKQEIRKTSILGSPVELDYVLRHTSDELRMKIMKRILDVVDAGLELSNPHYHQDLPEQTKAFVIDMAQHVEQAIEEFIDDEQG